MTTRTHPGATRHHPPHTPAAASAHAGHPARNSRASQTAPAGGPMVKAMTKLTNKVKAGVKGGARGGARGAARREVAGRAVGRAAAGALEALETRRMLSGTVELEQFDAAFNIVESGRYAETERGKTNLPKWLRVDDVEFGDGRGDVALRYGTNQPGGAVELWVEDRHGTMPIDGTRARRLGAAELRPTGHDDTFADARFDLHQRVGGQRDLFLLSAGDHDIGHLDALSIGGGTGTGGGDAAGRGVLVEETFDVDGRTRGDFGPDADWYSIRRGGQADAAGGEFKFVNTGGVSVWFTDQFELTGEAEVELDVAPVGNPSGVLRAFLRRDGEVVPGSSRTISSADAIPGGPLSLGTVTGRVQIEVHVDSPRGGYELDAVRVVGTGSITAESGRPQNRPQPVPQAPAPEPRPAPQPTKPAPQPTKPAPQPTKPGPQWELKWGDEFNGRAGSGVSGSWIATGEGDPYHQQGRGVQDDGGYGLWGRGNAWGNRESGYNTSRPENVSHDGRGNLKITARRDDSKPLGFTSARIETRDRYEFKYGRLEARMQVPSSDGLHTAFWTMGHDVYGHNWPLNNGWPMAGEVDVVETLGQQPSVVRANAHGPRYGGDPWSAYGRGRYDTVEAPGVTDAGEDLTKGFHTYAIEWGPNKIEWFLDGEKYHEATRADMGRAWVFDKEHFVIFSVSVGNDRNWAGPPEHSFQSDSLLIDYVRVYGQA